MRKSLCTHLVVAHGFLDRNLRQQQQRAAATPEEQAACNRDVQRHCRKVIDQGDFTILACLKENRSQISAACNQVLKTHGQ